MKLKSKIKGTLIVLWALLVSPIVVPLFAAFDLYDIWAEKDTAGKYGEIVINLLLPGFKK